MFKPSKIYPHFSSHINSLFFSVQRFDLRSEVPRLGFGTRNRNYEPESSSLATVHTYKTSLSSLPTVSVPVERRQVQTGTVTVLQEVVVAGSATYFFYQRQRQQQNQTMKRQEIPITGVTQTR